MVESFCNEPAEVCFMIMKFFGSGQGKLIS